MRHLSMNAVLGFVFFAISTSTAPDGSAVAAPLHTAPGATHSESFDLGPDEEAELPLGWRVDTLTPVRTRGGYAEASRTTQRNGGDSLASNAPSGCYNFGAGPKGGAEDRAIGFISAGAAARSGNLYLRMRNLDSNPVEGLTISYSIEKYRNGTNPAGYSFRLFYSDDGTDWQDAGEDFHSFFPPDEDCAGFAAAPGLTTNIIAKGLDVSISSGEEFYLAWSYSVESGGVTTYAQALAIDDVVIETGGQAGGRINLPPVISLSGAHCTLFMGGEAATKVTASDPDGDAVSISVFCAECPDVGNSLDPQTGVFTWTPPGPGQYLVEFTAEDCEGAEAVAVFEVNVVRVGEQVEGELTWDFETAFPITTPGACGISGGPAGAFQSGNVAFLQSGVSSRGYDGASGGCNGAIVAPVSPVFDADTCAYMAWTLSPDANVAVSMSSVTFGSRSTGTGPQAIELCALASDGTLLLLGSFTTENNSTWRLHQSDLDLVFDAVTEFRLYAWNSTGGSTSANWRVDDLTMRFSTRCIADPAALMKVR